MEGSIVDKGETRKGHAWLLRVFVSRDANGRRRYVSKTVYAKSERQAEKELRKWLNEREGLEGYANDEMVVDYLKRWLEVYKSTVRETTHELNRKLFERHIYSVIAKKKLSKVTPLDVQALVDSMVAKSIASQTIRNVMAVFGVAMKQAVEWGMIVKSPVRGLKLPKLHKQEMSVFSAEELKTIFASDNKDVLLYRLLVEVGCRPGEAFALQWKDVDFERRMVTISKTLVYVNGETKVHTTKTTAGVRSVPISSTLMFELKRALVKTKFKGDMDMVFTNSKGKPYDKWSTGNRFRYLLKKLELPQRRLYDLRHTCATLLLLAGEHPKVVSERLGHANISITLNTYSHVLPNMQERATSSLERMLY